MAVKVHRARARRRRRAFRERFAREARARRRDSTIPTSSPSTRRARTAAASISSCASSHGVDLGRAASAQTDRLRSADDRRRSSPRSPRRSTPPTTRARPPRRQAGQHPARRAPGRSTRYLTDFGITPRRSRRDRGLTAAPVRSWAASTTPRPEQIRRRARAGPAGDLYALGCVAFECLTGVPPFQREHDVSTLWAHVNDPPPRAPSLGAPRRRCSRRAEIDERCRCAQLAKAARAIAGRRCSERRAAPRRPPSRYAKSRSVTTPRRSARSTSVARFWLCGTASSSNASNSALMWVLIESTDRNSSPASSAFVGRRGVAACRERRPAERYQHAPLGGGDGQRPP